MSPLYGAALDNMPLATAHKTFVVPGPPVPLQRARRGAGGRFYTPRASKVYKDKVGWLARQAGVRCLKGPVRLTVAVWVPDARRRDVDNVAKACMDALTGIAWQDDSQVSRLVVTRQLDRERPRVVVTVEAVEPGVMGVPSGIAWAGRRHRVTR